ncbi:uncharacterized protein MKK02DRAFT_42489 [Dioszegia hungarica]|uniref:Uncharacterized protein n=1 Tax=Dioszegia hungarica TaxID=4972 RepID=A0AA38LXZ9_9TREE|nr:uncharacterized protein MKK02DRAFT_42489 [Dioszegia hungarica]KAI9638101.1 hypothetical protein MKK02DRAFT_42489 [Dioszegia hungarica]
MSSSQYQSQANQASRPSRTPSPSIHQQSQSQSRTGSANNSPGAPRLPPKDAQSQSHSGSRTASRSSPRNNNPTTTKTDYLTLPPSTSSFSNLARYASGNSNSAADDDLVQAVRDSVQIRSPSPSPSAQQSTYLARPLEPTIAPQRRSPSPRMPSANFRAQPDFSASPDLNSNATAGFQFQPGHGYSHSSPDMSGLVQPTMGRGGAAVMNPFEEEDVHQSQGTAGNGTKHRSPEAAGVVAPSRQKFSRANTA